MKRKQNWRMIRPPRPHVREDKTDLYERYKSIMHKQFTQAHDKPYDKRTERDWEIMREFYDDLMEEANKENKKDE